MDIVHQHEGIWYFWNEVCDKKIGYYTSKAGAEAGLEAYSQQLQEKKEQIDGEN